DAIIAVAWANLSDVACLPQLWVDAIACRLQPQVKRGGAGASWIEAAALGEYPVLVRRLTPVERETPMCDFTKVILPLTEGAGLGLIHFDHVKQRGSSTRFQRLLQVAAKAAEVPIVAITQRQHTALQIAQVQVCNAVQKAVSVIRCFPFAIGADNEQRAPAVLQPGAINAVEG